MTTNFYTAFDYILFVQTCAIVIEMFFFTDNTSHDEHRRVRFGISFSQLVFNIFLYFFPFTLKLI